MSVGNASARDAKELVLQAFCDWPSGTGADDDTVYRADGRDLRRRAAEEDLVSHVQSLTGD